MTITQARRVATRMGSIGTESAFEVSARARALAAQGRPMIYLQIGEPDFDTPANVRAAAKRALDEGETHYAPFPGIPALREAIAADVAMRKGVEADPSQVFVTVGGKGVMLYAIFGLVDPGDEVIVPDPGYPIYESLTRFVGATPVPIPIRMENEFRLDVDELASLITPRTRVLFINSPANPTGGVLDRDQLERIAQLAVEHDLIVMADEIYAELIYDGEHTSIATFPGMAERTVILDGFSKTYAMTGWRLGYGIFPKDLAPAITKLAVNSVSCTSVAVQRAGIAALTGPQDRVGEFREAFRSRRGLIVDGLNAIDGISCVMPKGAFYAFPNITQTGLTSKQFADRLLDEYGVAGIAGTSFGEAGEGYLRLSYANSDANLNKALERVAAMTKDVLG